MTPAQAARRWRVSHRAMNAWLSGERPVPGWLEHVVALETGKVEPTASYVEPDDLQ